MAHNKLTPPHSPLFGGRVPLHLTAVLEPTHSADQASLSSEMHLLEGWDYKQVTSSPDQRLIYHIFSLTILF